MDIKKLQNQQEEGEALRELASAYGEIASNKIKQIRTQVEENRTFFEEISYVYYLVQTVAKQRKIALKKPKERICILITSNYRFYGNLNNELINFFIVDTSKYNTDRLIIGQTAVDYLKGINYFHNFQKVILTTDIPTPVELQNMASLIKEYKEVLVFYSESKSLLVQVPKIKNLNGTKEEQLSKEKDFNLQTNFIVEPDIDKMLDFFESQIAILILQQMFLESQLARTASRLISMDQAQIEAKKYIQKANRDLSLSKRALNGNRILESIALQQQQPVIDSD